jgi:pilus assembly protein Flp/PilA
LTDVKEDVTYIKTAHHQHSQSPEEDVMKWIRNLLVKFSHDEEGATATEYAVMLVLIIVVALATITILGQEVKKGFNKVAIELQKANT